MISAAHSGIVQRCQQSCVYFLRNFAKTKHPSAGVLPFNPWGYQVGAIRAFRKHRFSIFKKVRQSGISCIAGKFALWYSMFFNHRKTLVVSRSDDTAMEFLSENVTFTFDNLPQWMQDLWRPVKKNEHELVFPNGSSITSLTSHPDVLRSHASSLNIVDEAAFIQDMPVMWAGGYPTLIHGGTVIVISTCVHPDTYIITERGLQRIRELAPAKYQGYQPDLDDRSGYDVASCDRLICSPAGHLAKATRFYRRKPEPTRKIKTRSGYRLEASLRHRLKVLHGGEVGYQHVADIDIGDYVPIGRGMNRFGDEDHLGFADTGAGGKRHPTELRVPKITEELAYLVGLIVAEGSISDTYVDLTNGNASVRSKCFNNKLGLKWIPNPHFEGDECHIRCCSTRFVRLLKLLGMQRCRAWDKEIPARLLRCSRKIIVACLRGLMDGDGFSRVRDGEVALCSTSTRLIEQVRLLLLNFGVVSREECRPEYIRQFDLNNRSYESHCRDSYRLVIRSGEAVKFFAAVGFGIGYKQANHSQCRPSKEFIPGARELFIQFRRETGLSITEMTKLGVGPPLLFGRSDRPQSAAGRHVVERFLVKTGNYAELPSRKALVQLADPRIFWDEITSLENGESEVMDFTIPETQCFWTNGFDSHNTNGVGNWYWNTWTDAEAGLNSFHPILVNWWDMDWTISYRDDLSGEQRSICPTDGIRKCETPEDIQKWGPYYSPWLEEQWKGLQEKGESWKFDQEILGRFIGSGRTIISQLALQYVESRISDRFSKVQNEQAYVHPVTGEGKKINLNVGEQHQLAAGDGLWVWRPPEKGKPPVVRAGHIVDPGMPGHRYIAGIDLMTGRGADYHAMEIFDVDTQEQAAEIMMHALPMEFKLVVDYLGRWYNNALLVIERNNGGDAFIDELRLSLMYPNLWRKKTPQDKPHKADGVKLKIAEYGFNTGGVSKEQLNQRLIDYIRADSATVRLYSRRLYKQLQIYVRLKDRAGRDTGKTGAEEGPGNHDDLVIASGLAFVGWPDAIQADSSGLVPFQEQMRQEEYKPPETAEQLLSRCAALAGPNFVMPMPGAPSNLGPMGIMEELERFTRQIGGVPISPQNLQLVSSRSANPYKR